MKHGFVKVAAAVPAVKVADVTYNVQEIERLITIADVEHVEVRDENLNKLGKQIAILQNSPKSKSSVRLLHLNDTANAIIQYYYEEQKKNGIESEFIICSRDGSFLTPSGFRKAFRNIAHNADITEAGIHSLRHTFATELYRKGVDVKMILISKYKNFVILY